MARSHDLCSISLYSSCPNNTVENSLLLLCQTVPLDCELLKAKDLLIIALPVEHLIESQVLWALNNLLLRDKE